MNPYVYCCITYNSQDKEATIVSISRWMGKEEVVHIHNRILFSHKKKRNPAICNKMDGSRDYYARWNKPGRERQYHIISLICGCQCAWITVVDRFMVGKEIADKPNGQMIQHLMDHAKGVLSCFYLTIIHSVGQNT